MKERYSLQKWTWLMHESENCLKDFKSQFKHISYFPGFSWLLKPEQMFSSDKCSSKKVKIIKLPSFTHLKPTGLSFLNTKLMLWSIFTVFFFKNKSLQWPKPQQWKITELFMTRLCTTWAVMSKFCVYCLFFFQWVSEWINMNLNWFKRTDSFTDHSSSLEFIWEKQLNISSDFHTFWRSR